MEWVETTGRTVAEALESALDELGVDEHDAEVVVVAEARSGILGIGRSDARVRARVRPAAPRPKRPQRGRHRDQSRPSRASRDATATTDDEPGAADVETSPVPTGASGSPRRRRGGKAKSVDKPAERPRPEGEEAMSLEQQAETVGAFVEGVVERFGYAGVSTVVRVEEDQIVVEVEGENLGLLIGQRGRTLEALQELSRTVLQRRGDEPSARVIVDVAGFRAKRIAALEAFVRRTAEEVIATGEPQELEPMPAPDRKVVHDTVNGIAGVESTSEGTDPDRYVVLRPAAGAREETFA